MEKFDQSKYIQSYMKDKYKRIPLDVKKDEYEKLCEHAKAKGYDKINTFIKDLIKKDMGQGV